MDPKELKVRIFADGADEAAIADLAQNPLVRGFTTNPTLLKAAGVTDYAAFAKRVLAIAGLRPVSFEVLADELDEMEQQALVIDRWGGNAVVKIPITNSRGLPTTEVVNHLASRGVAVNVTAVFTTEQIAGLELNSRCYVSVFAGRIADAGVFPVSVIQRMLTANRDLRIIWASPRELANVIQADAVGCHAITLTRDLIAKLPLLGKDLREYSLETVQGFYRDAVLSGLTI